ncbi:MAG: aspartate--ammonia ligase [Christensenellales bacterium]|jgi:aspartate--ammonia ligase
MISKTYIPENYRPRLSLRETERAIKLVKDGFERNLAEKLNLERISAPLFILPASGLNDNLSGVERPVDFDIPCLKDTAEIIHSLAKWKRMALHRYGFFMGEGIYTDMNAIRRDEELDNIHSIYVDQWDWEKIMDRSQRTIDYLKEVVGGIVDALKMTLEQLKEAFPAITLEIGGEVKFISSQELLDRYPVLPPKERENAICKEYGVVFITQIGKTLSDGTKHDGRAPDYDDWELNGDLMVWNDVLKSALELSSMGIRVDDESLLSQLKASGCMDRANLPFHSMLLSKKLPLTIGGGIGQSRLCMYLLQMAHIGEVQASLWSQEDHDLCESKGVLLL